MLVGNFKLWVVIFSPLKADHFQTVGWTEARKLIISEDQVNKQPIELQKLSAGILWFVLHRSDQMIKMGLSNPKI